MATNRGIQVSGQRSFSGKEWKEAFLHYLQGMLSGDMSVTYRPKIRISDDLGDTATFTLTFGFYGTANPVYWAEGATLDEPPPRDFNEKEVLIVDCQQPAAEWGLARFVNNEQVKCLWLRLGSLRNLVLWKKPEDELGVAIEYRD